MSKYLTIPGFTNLTKREAIEISVKHVLANGKPSISEFGGCYYSGCGCAAAPFLRPEVRQQADNADKLYASGDTCWNALVDAKLVQKHLRDTIKLLQSCHDESEFAYRRGGSSAEFIKEFKSRLVFYSLVEADDPLLQ